MDSYASAMAAARGGADRRDCDVKVNVLIRPRFGDFLYDRAVLEVRLRD